MKKISILLGLFAAAVFAQNIQQNFTRGHEYCAYKKQNSSHQVLFEKANIRHSFDVLNYKLNLDIYNCFISPYPKSFTASVVITARADSMIDYINLNAVNTSLTIDGVGLAGSSFTHTSNIVKVNLNRTYIAGEVFDVLINYRHNNVSDGAVNVSGGFFFTDCEPEGARKWYPCWDKPSDKATLDLTARVPATVKLGSNGRLADSTKIQDTIYYRWVSRDNIATYLVVISAKVNYNLDIVYWKKLSNPNDSVPMRFYWNAGESTTNLNAMKNVIGPMTTYFSQKFGEHPFEKNGFATLNNSFAWGGMENQTLTSLCPNCWSENLISHEYAHQWFGDMITCATWADITLNEGFATYCEALWYEKTTGYSAYKQDINNNASSYISSNPGWAIYNPDWAITTPNTNTLFNTAITYYKGACVLHMLRYVMGDTLFFRGLYAYANNPELKYRSAVLEDLKNSMSATYGQDLTWFFDAWYKQPNHPIYANKYFITTDGTNYVVGFIAYQSQTNSAFHKMFMDVKVTFSNGSDTTLRVFNSVNNQLFNFRFTKQPTAIVFDPNNDIVLKSATLTATTAAPMLITPVNNAVNQPQTLPFTWTSVSGASSYTLQISTSPEFTSFVFNDSTITTTTKNVGPLPNQARYYWRVFAKTVSGNTPYSETWTFLVGTNCKDVSLNENWNLVSVPYLAANMTVSVLFPLANSPAYYYANGYTLVSTLTNGQGYWLRFPALQNTVICGNPVATNTIPLLAGWNLIGVNHTSVPVGSLTVNPPGNLTSFFYGYEGNYVQASTLVSGKGYWIRAAQNGSLTLPVSSLKLQEGIQPSGAGVWNGGKIVVKDAVGHLTLLSFASTTKEITSDFDLPPLPPDGTFDVRFSNNRIVTGIGSSADILLQGCIYPVALTAEGVSVRLKDKINGKFLDTELASGSSITISDNQIIRLAVESQTIKPLEFSLKQNYPNPFNPETRITFSVPERSDIQLTVYDQLGNRVVQLASGIFDAGEYETVWNASQVTSGIYFYELRCSKFQSVRKMIYLR